ncbi:hypothetical protein DRQ25_11745 [Candidatus Fermentibacteria bacterium]|nr:MAG: hypothetical protein DRQ25_11745 [Candidatus Fermentibacteria bacterium]
MLKLYTLISVISILTSAAVSAGDIIRGEDSFSAVLDAGSNVVITNINGDITIEEWNSDQVLIEYTIDGDQTEEIESINVDCNYINGLFCEVTYLDDWDGSEVDFHVRLPESLYLNLVMRTFDGCISLNSGMGTSLVEIINGSAVLEGFAGELTVNVVKGEIDLIDVPGLSVVNIVEGTIRGTIDNIERDVEISTVSGFIDLVLEGAASVSVSTMSGSIDIPGAEIYHDLIGSSTEFGDGEFRINITTVSGDVSIRR